VSLRVRFAVALSLFLGSACGPKPTTTEGPRTTKELQAEWEAVLQCQDVETCLEAIDRPRYVLDVDATRMAERLTSFGEAAVPHLAKAAKDWNAPRRREIAETALLAMKGPALSYAREHDDAQGFDLLVRIALETDLLPQAYPDLVERLPRNRGWLFGHLRAGPPTAERNPGLAVIRLLGSAAKSEVVPLCNVLDGEGRSDWNLAVNTARAIGFIGAEEGTDCLVRVLDIPSWRVTSAALEGLARIGQGARSAQRAILAVATSHWSQRVRWRAVTTMRFLREENRHDQLEAVMRAIDGGHSYADFLGSADALADPVSRAFATVPANDSTERENTPVCAWNRRTMTPIEVRWQGDVRTLTALDSKQTRERRRRYASKVPNTTLEGLGIGLDVLLSESVRDIRPKGIDYVVAACAGEFGGGLLRVTPTGKVAVLRRGCFVATRQVGGAIWVFEGSQHLGDGHGRLWRMQATGNSWAVAPVVDLPGNPLAAHVGRDWVLVATNLGDVAVTRAGAVTPLACEPS
jgi:hypothetical protein